MRWTTPRTLTIGSTGKSVDGSGNVSWSLAEIGAQAAGSYQPLENQRLSTTNGPTFTSVTAPLLSGTTISGWKGTVPAYVKVATATIHNQYDVVSGRMRFKYVGDNAGTQLYNVHSGAVCFRLKQQYAMSSTMNAPAIWWEGSTGLDQTQFFAIKSTDNSSTKALDLYFRVDESYDGLQFIWEEPYGTLTPGSTYSTTSPGTPTYTAVKSLNVDIYNNNVNVLGGFTVSGIANAAYLGADANGKLTAKTIAASDLPASIQTAQSIPVDRVAIGNGSSGLSSDSGLQLLRKTTGPYSGYQLQAGKATMGTWSSDATMAWFGAVGYNNSYNNYYGIATDGTTTIVGAATSVKLRAANGDGLTVSYQPEGNAGAIASGNFQRTWQTGVATLPNTSGLPVGFEVHALYPMAPSGASVSVYNTSTERIRFRDRSTNAITTDSKAVFVGQAVDFIFLGTYSGTAFWSANSI